MRFSQLNGFKHCVAGGEGLRVAFSFPVGNVALLIIEDIKKMGELDGWNLVGLPAHLKVGEPLWAADNNVEPL